jgi:hypothetical protein
MLYENTITQIQVENAKHNMFKDNSLKDNFLKNLLYSLSVAMPGKKQL